jgi:hypothetical protein
MLAQVPMDAKLAESLQQVAAERGKPLEVVMNDLVQNYLREQRHTQLLAEMDRFLANHRELVSRFNGEYIGLHNGEVLDHDGDGGTLYKRLRQRYGSLPVLVVQVTESPEQEFTVRHPKLEPAE